MKTLITTLFIFANIQNAWAQSNDIYSIEAKKIVERLSGTKVPADHPLLLEATAALRSGNRLGASQAGTKHPGFLNSTVKLMALKMSTREETINLVLNDFAASFIGTVRDNGDARDLLTGDFHYAGNPTVYAPIAGNAYVPETSPDFVRTNLHYLRLEHRLIDIGKILVRRTGQQIIGRANVNGENVDALVRNPDAAGVLTSATFMRSHADAGTNRRLVEYAFREFMCIPLEEWADASASDAWIGRDIDRFPGGDHQKFQTSCKSCHTVMDGFRGAFAKWDSDGDSPFHASSRPDRFDRTTGVSGKMNKNESVFRGGYVTRSEAFVNNARGPANEALFGWREYSTGGAGVKGLGMAIAYSRRFSQCMVKRVYDSVCRANLDLKTEASFVQPFATRFEERKYNLRELFEQIAILPSCIGNKGAP